jgi:hypothetical protein
MLARLDTQNRIVVDMRPSDPGFTEYMTRFRTMQAVAESRQSYFAGFGLSLPATDAPESGVEAKLVGGRLVVRIYPHHARHADYARGLRSRSPEGAAMEAMLSLLNAELAKMQPARSAALSIIEG